NNSGQNNNLGSILDNEKKALVANMVFPGSGYVLNNEIRKGVIILLLYLAWLCVDVFLIVSIFGCCIVLPVEVGIRWFIYKEMTGDIFCPHCKFKIARDAVFCSACGKDINEKEIKPLTKCPKCDNDVNTSDLYCDKCGENLVSDIE
ncbi:MAG: zinc ribbon domain-containing protein, partial [Cyanobacteriota bacterium]